MKADIKELWINALTSGEYRQGKGVLRGVTKEGDVEWCCLGVLCDLAVNAGVELAYIEDAAPLHHFGPTAPEDGTYSTYDGDGAYLPVSVQEWSGLDYHNPVMPGDAPFYGDTLSVLNDKGHSFTEIAEAIKAHL